MNIIYKETKWLKFIETGQKTKTVVIQVYNKKGHFLGEISWGPWRQYTYQSCGGTIYNNRCLTDIADVLSSLNEEHKGNGTD